MATVAHFNSLGVAVDRVMTDNGGRCRSKAFARYCASLGIKHPRIKTHTPQHNCEAERFNQMALRAWAFATAFDTSDQRKAELPIWQRRYNGHRPHASLAKLAPIAPIVSDGSNVMESPT